jgi:hypothetical protein
MQINQGVTRSDNDIFSTQPNLDVQLLQTEIVARNCWFETTRTNDLSNPWVMDIQSIYYITNLVITAALSERKRDDRST